MSQKKSAVQLTIRGFEPELLRRLELLAGKQGVSLNQAALRLMRIGAGLESAVQDFEIGPSLDKYAGVWNDQDYEEFTRATQEFELINPEMW
ncbi:hypothetical protein IV102_16150 [bacterium]|nr:hypothetical protein [bacterium]